MLPEAAELPFPAPEEHKQHYQDLETGTSPLQTLRDTLPASQKYSASQQRAAASALSLTPWPGEDEELGALSGHSGLTPRLLAKLLYEADLVPVPDAIPAHRVRLLNTSFPAKTTVKPIASSFPGTEGLLTSHAVLY